MISGRGGSRVPWGASGSREERVRRAPRGARDGSDRRVRRGCRRVPGQLTAGAPGVSPTSPDGTPAGRGAPRRTRQRADQPYGGTPGPGAGPVRRCRASVSPSGPGPAKSVSGAETLPAGQRRGEVWRTGAGRSRARRRRDAFEGPFSAPSGTPDAGMLPAGLLRALYTRRRASGRPDGSGGRSPGPDSPLRARRRPRGTRKPPDHGPGASDELAPGNGLT